MFESNFPVDGWSCSYGVVWNAFKRMVAGASAREKRDLFHDTAARGVPAGRLTSLTVLYPRPLPEP